MSRRKSSYFQRFACKQPTVEKIPPKEKSVIIWIIIKHKGKAFLTTHGKEKIALSFSLAFPQAFQFCVSVQAIETWKGEKRRACRNDSIVIFPKVLSPKLNYSTQKLPQSSVIKWLFLSRTVESAPKAFSPTVKLLRENQLGILCKLSSFL